jgi:hypothetical protein
MKAKKLKKRDSLIVFISCKAFPRYKIFVEADVLVNRIHSYLLNNKDMFATHFTARVSQPLMKITEDREKSKKYVISFLRRLASWAGNVLVCRRKSRLVDKRMVSVYSYCLVKV